MGFVRTVDTPDGLARLLDHEGEVAQVWDDGTERVGGGYSEASDRYTVEFRAACSCGWRSVATVKREPGESAFRDLIDLPALGDEWKAHTAPFLAHAAGHRTRARFDDSLGHSAHRATCTCGWEADGEPKVEAGTLRDQRAHQDDVLANCDTGERKR